MLDLKENIDFYYNKVDPVNPIDSDAACNNIAKSICFDLLENGLNIQDINEIMLRILQKNDRVKLKDYIIYKEGKPRCKICETKSSIEMHHIKPKSKRPDLEYDSDNIVFLCESCHRIIHGHFQISKAIDNKVKNKIQQTFKEKLNKNLGNEILVKLAGK